MAKKTSMIRIWRTYKENGLVQESPSNITFRSFREAEKCADYLNSKKTDNSYDYFYRHEVMTEYKTAQEYIDEQESTKELS